MTSLREAALALPDQLRWSAAAAVSDVPRAESAVVVGMGGSGIAGDVAAVVADAHGAPVLVHKSYGLPGWAGALRPLVVAVSFSGETEETASAVETAAELELPVAVVAGGGRLARQAADHGWPLVTVPEAPAPRAAIGFLAGSVLRVLEAGGLVSETGIDEAVERLAEQLDDGRGIGVRLADDIATQLSGRLVAVYAGPGPAAVAAQRWRSELNENAKTTGWYSVLPELHHNEIEGWGTLTDVTARHVAVVALHDPHLPPPIRRRMGITLRLLEGRVPLAGEVVAQGDGPLARTLTLAVVGDLVSLRVAEEADVDPVPVDTIETLKRLLAEEPS